MFHEYSTWSDENMLWNGNGSGVKNFSWNGSEIDETNVADMEAGVMKIFCRNGSRSNEKNVSWNRSGIDETNSLLLTWKLEWLKYVAEMEAGVTKRLFPEMEVGLMKLMLLNWKLEWWKYVIELEAGLMKRMFPEMESVLTKRMLLTWKREILWN